MPKHAASLDIITLTDTPECAAQLLEAAKTLGFVYITMAGTEITPEAVDEMFEIVS
jgi:hypothetical protein